MIVLFKINPNRTLTKVADVNYDEETFRNRFDNDFSILDPNYNNLEYIHYITTEEDVLNLKEKFLDENNVIIDLTTEKKRELKILPPSDEPIYKLINNEWIIDPTLLYTRKSVLATELYELRKEKTGYFNITLYGKTYKQRWQDFDLIRIEAAIRELLANPNLGTINWRFNGIDLSQTVALTKEDLNNLFEAGKYNEKFQTLIQYFVFEELLPLANTTGFNIKNKFKEKTEYFLNFSKDEINSIYNNL
jgi:hypothetical protein